MYGLLNRSYLPVLLLLLVLGVNVAEAQQQKIGYVNTNLILNEIPEYQGVQQQLRIVSEEWRTEIDRMQQEVKRLEEDFEAKEILYTDEVREQKRREIEQMKRAKRDYLEQKFGPEGEYFKKQQELLAPIQRNIYEAVRVVAQRRGFDFVFDRAQNTSLLFGQKQWDLNQYVLQELGVSLNN